MTARGISNKLSYLIENDPQRPHIHLGRNPKTSMIRARKREKVERRIRRDNKKEN
jgi:hypothetical protein